jgi:hypothetical protein
MRHFFKVGLTACSLGLPLVVSLPLAGCGGGKPETGTVVQETQAERDAWKAEAQAPAVGDRPTKKAR